MEFIYFVIRVIVVAYLLYLVYFVLSILIAVVIETLQRHYKWARNIFTHTSKEDHFVGSILEHKGTKEDKL